MIGRTISHYKIVDKLGEGGMGSVYKAEDQKLKRTVALKFLSEETHSDPEVKERFLIEAQAAAALDHPNIGVVYEIAESTDGELYIVMGYYEGMTLRDMLSQGPLPVDQALDFSLQMAEGLAEAHHKGVLHRDIKPANVIVTDEGKVKIVDFGLAKLANMHLTKTGSTLGTIAYMAPEQARGEAADQRSDIWSLGTVIYELLSGIPAFQGETEASIINAILHNEPIPLEEYCEEIPLKLEAIVRNSLQKRIEKRYSTVDELALDLKNLYDDYLRPEKSAFDIGTLLITLKRPSIAVSGIVAIALVGALALSSINKSGKIRWAEHTAIPEIRQLVTNNEFYAAFEIAKEVQQYLPDDPELIGLWPQFSRHTTITCTPTDAEVYWGDYPDEIADLEYLGTAPIDSLRFPHGFLRLFVKRDGFEAREVIWNNAWSLSESSLQLQVVLDEQGTTPDGMARVPGKNLRLSLTGFDSPEKIPTNTYFVDLCEVTNSQFKTFIDNGGYTNRDYWNVLENDFSTISWAEVDNTFRDQTGRPGPSTWQGGTFPIGEEDFPVRGISWYEAAAFAEYSGKQLPSIYHWLGATRTSQAPIIIRHSNFNGSGPVPVGSTPSSRYGIKDMAGNVREWCWNRTGDRNFILGGSWGEPTYMYYEVAALPPLDRSPENGFRCAIYPGPDEANLVRANRPIEIPTFDPSQQQPVSDEIFEIFKGQYSYDSLPLEPTLEHTNDSMPHWRVEKVTINTAYGSERMDLYIYIPKHVSPPYQTVVFFPGSGAILIRSSDSLINSTRFEHLILSGRVLVRPVLKGTYERNSGEEHSFPSLTREYSNFVYCLVNDIRRSIDYIETRDELNSEMIAYYGFSWGGRLGSIVLALEERIKSAFWLVGGYSAIQALPEASEFNFTTRVTQPVLMVNGTRDVIFPLETSVRPLFERLGTLDEEKALELFDAGHGISNTHKNMFSQLLVEWLDLTLGIVR
ncbi:protein kinase [Gemmatimonadota bacterium]